LASDHQNVGKVHSDWGITPVLILL